jgi:UPF0716 protein FxsA
MILLALLLLPFIEIVIAVSVVREFGFANAFFAWLVSTVLGLGLFRSSTLRLTVGVAKAMREGKPPGLAALDGAMIGLAGVLFLLPGYLSDLVAIVLLVPPVRRFAAERFHRAFGGGMVFTSSADGPNATQSGPFAGSNNRAGPSSGGFDADDAAHAVLDVDAVVIDDKQRPE